ncbi:MAG: 16S rRNA (cytosine(1402)-N(4))-methyltransferase RsmH [Verrucomicrobiae bacterium]|nr:16S rRNA (cytosine(1402)-N(4))-methyltransferase RsmH [Verrucomicrobiae bacterium]
MLEEVVHFLAPSRGKLFLDGTLGGGGHTRRLLEEGANVIGLDRDPDALQFARQRLAEFGDSFSAIHTDFRDYGELLGTVGIGSGLDGILLDLGVSSRQLENPDRGFSFQGDGPLDMRMNPEAELSAEVVVNEWDEDELIRIFHEYGEERSARRIAQAIVKARKLHPITTTLQLADLVETVVPRRGRQHPATRIFQAIRIAVNDEFGALRAALEEAHRWLRPGGRLVVITFHSLEDRIVKQFMRHQCMEWIDRPELPEPIPNPECYFDAVVRKALAPSEEETAENPRARSAKLRVVERRTVDEKAAK